MVDQKLIEFLTRLGVDPEGAKIYLALVSKKSLTAQQIARATGIPKTTIYRRTDELKSLGIIEEQIDEYKKKYLAADPELLNLLVVNKEEEAKQLRAELPEVAKLLIPPNSDPETKVLFYRGRDGIQQMNWNTLKTNGELLGYTYRAWEEIVGAKYIKDYVRELELLNMSGRELYSKSYLQSRKEWTEITGKWPNWQMRYIEPKILNINHQMDVYNDVVAIYNWHEGEVFGVEIYNQKIADMQKQVFEVLWKLGKNHPL